MKKFEMIKVSADIKPLAAGLMKLFTDEEKAILRIGMLPHRIMDSFEKNLRAKFSEDFNQTDPTAKLEKLIPVDGPELFETIEFTINEIVGEITHELSIELYRTGDLVV